MESKYSRLELSNSDLRQHQQQQQSVSSSVLLRVIKCKDTTRTLEAGAEELPDEKKIKKSHAIVSTTNARPPVQARARPEEERTLP